MVYVLYDRKGQVTGFSESQPKSQRYFQFRSKLASILAKGMKGMSWSYLEVDKHEPVRLHHSIELDDGKDYVAINDSDIPLKLLRLSLRDLKTAQQDLETILAGRRTEKKYEQ